MKWILCLVTATGLIAAADTSLTVNKLAEFIRSSIQQKLPDRQVAEYLKRVKLTEKLDDQTIEDLVGQGAGPKIVAALKELRDASAKLPTAAAAPPAKPAYVPPPAPPQSEQAKIIEEARKYARTYTENLPNFICAQVTRRYGDLTGTGNSFRLLDTVMAKLSYDGHHEDYQVISVNNSTVTNVTMEKLGGTVSVGEFGSMMKQIFDPQSEAHFEPRDAPSGGFWGKLRGRETYVFSYDIDQPHSRFHVTYEKTDDIVPAYRGQVYIDKDTGMVTKITQIPYAIPESFPVQNVNMSLDYDFVKIGDGEYLVPLKSVNTSNLARVLKKNEIEFRLYRKFGTESTIKFDTPDPLPDDKTKEKKQ